MFPTIANIRRPEHRVAKNSVLATIITWQRMHAGFAIVPRGGHTCINVLVRRVWEGVNVFHADPLLPRCSIAMHALWCYIRQQMHAVWQAAGVP